MRLFSTGNFAINTTTDAGFRLDVNGTARFSGLVTATLSNYNSTHSGNTTRGFYIVNSSDSVVRGGIEYDGTNAFVQLAGRYNNGAAFSVKTEAMGIFRFCVAVLNMVVFLEQQEIGASTPPQTLALDLTLTGLRG